MKEISLKLPPGEWVVWWYSTVVKNNEDNTVPLVNVVFRGVDGDVLMEETETRRIALSRLRLYRIGVILKEGYPVARMALSTEYFDVDFSYGWKLNRASRHKLCASTSPHALPEHCNDDWLLRFNQPDRKILILNCIDFLVSGYSMGSEIPRILTTYEWPEVLKRLLAQPTPPTEKNLHDRLVVYPHKKMLLKDQTFLALLANENQYTTQAAKTLFSQINPKSFKLGQPHSLMVRPWFLGQTRLKCRGFWTPDKMQFLCTALVGFEEPSGLNIDNRGFVGKQNDNATEDKEIPSDAGRRLAENDLDIIMTDEHQPSSSYVHENIEAEEFEFVITRESTRTLMETPFDRRTVLPMEEVSPEQYGTGDNQGQGDATTGKMTANAQVVDIDVHGTLVEMWDAFVRMTEVGEIDELSWYVPDKDHTQGPPKCLAFSNRSDLGSRWKHKSAEAQAEEREKQEKWITLKENVRRGMMYLLITVENDLFLVAEVQRHRWIGRDKKPKEQSFCGLICHIHDQNRQKIQQICSHIDCELPEHNGVFKNMSWPFDYQSYIFSHHSSTDPKSLLDKAAANALNTIRDLAKRRLPS
ncbi:hypothetical protein [Pseudomonas chlororaphis]|uniref:hypothetical protein n=1 Tax=Pseudomonas chlororaphis TaxID=587753 RepID=UPI000F557186|nr:hypothetical protein [Pseudomonas chlororaphis]WDH59115.1 hypothetical protein PUP56_30085 [Pseudomonas chlororaphis]WQE18371.1 hypothetical protein U0007_28895 [Pseudomonas chlororaphis]